MFSIEDREENHQNSDNKFVGEEIDRIKSSQNKRGRVRGGADSVFSFFNCSATVLQN